VSCEALLVKGMYRRGLGQDSPGAARVRGIMLQSYGGPAARGAAEPARDPRAPQVVAGDELDEALTAAVTCCILAAAGPQRSRVLANLYKDERSARLPVFGFLEKVYLERILRPEEARAPPTAASPVPLLRAAHPRGARRAALPGRCDMRCACQACMSAGYSAGLRAACAAAPALQGPCPLRVADTLQRPTAKAKAPACICAVVELLSAGD
jgi:hypothetical protein